MKEETPEKKVKSYSEQIRKEISQWICFYVEMLGMVKQKLL